MSSSIPNIFSEIDFDYAQSYVRQVLEETKDIQGAYIEIRDTPELRMFHEKVWEVAKKRFLNEKIMPSWQNMIIHKKIFGLMPPAIHDSACDYAVTIPLFQHVPWDILIGAQEKEYSLCENEGVFYRGNTEQTLRGPFQHPDTNIVVEAHFFFVEPDHWWFTPQEPEGFFGEEYLYKVIRAPKQ